MAAISKVDTWTNLNAEGEFILEQLQSARKRLSAPPKFVSELFARDDEESELRNCAKEVAKKLSGRIDSLAFKIRKAASELPATPEEVDVSAQHGSKAILAKNAYDFAFAFKDFLFETGEATVMLCYHGEPTPRLNEANLPKEKQALEGRVSISYMDDSLKSIVQVAVEIFYQHNHFEMLHLTQIFSTDKIESTIKVLNKMADLGFETEVKRAKRFLIDKYIVTSVLTRENLTAKLPHRIADCNTWMKVIKNHPLTRKEGRALPFKESLTKGVR